MAITATFKADFASFFDAVEKAEVSLKDLDSGAGKVGKSLDRMAEQFSGKKIIQEATLMAKAIGDVENVSRLTENEMKRVVAVTSEAIAKLHALGKEIPPELQKLADATKKIGQNVPDITKVADATTGVGKAAGGASKLLTSMAAQLAAVFTVGAIVQFGREILAAGDKIQKMADQTGLSVEQVQKLQYIAGQSGTSVDSLVSAVQNLQQRLGDDSSGATGAIKRLGLNLADIKAQNPYQQMVTLADAIRGIKDPSEQASAAAAIFGKNWKEILPAIKSGMKDVGDQAPQMSKDTVEALDRMGDAFVRLKDVVIVFGGTVLAKAGIAVEDFISKFNTAHFGQSEREIQRMTEALNAQSGLTGSLKVAADAAPKLTTQLRGLQGVLGPTAAEEEKFNEALKASIPPSAEAKKALESLANSLERVRYTQFKLGQAAVAAAKDTSPLLFSFGELVTISNDYSKKLTESQIKSDAFGHTLAVNVVPSLGTMGTAMAQNELRLAALDDATQGWRVELEKLGTAFAQMGQIGGNALSTITRGIGTAVTGLLVADKSIQSLKQGFADFGSSAIKGLAGIASGIGGFISLAATAVGWIKKLFGKSEESAKVSPLRDEFFKLAGGLDVLNPKVQQLTGNLGLVQAVFNAKTVEQYNKAIAELTGLFEFQAVALSTLDETAKKYGLTIEDLGPAWQRQELDKKAQELFKDYQILISAGVGHVKVLEKMSGSINEYVKNALKMGIEVPAAMRPMLEEMAKTGQLLDANGNKIEDLEKSGISFSMTMTEGFQALIKEVQKLTDIISKSLGTAIKNVPDADFDIRGHYVPPKDLPKGYDPDIPVIPQATGGMGTVSKPTLFLAGEAGPEDYWFSGANKQGKGGGDTAGLLEEIKGLRQQLARDRRSLVKDLRDAMLLAG